MSDLRLVRLTQSNPECWGHLPAVREAIRKAGAGFRQKGCPVVLDRIVSNFVMEGTALYQAAGPEERVRLGLDPLTTAVWYIWDDAAGVLRGHLVALQGDWDGETVVFIYQTWATRDSRGLRDPTFETLQGTASAELEHYARARGAARMVMYTRRPSRYWARFGFQAKRVMYEREIAP